MYNWFLPPRSDGEVPRELFRYSSPNLSLLLPKCLGLADPLASVRDDPVERGNFFHIMSETLWLWRRFGHNLADLKKAVCLPFIFIRGLPEGRAA